MDFVKRHKTKWQAAAIAAACLLVFALLWVWQASATRQNRMTIYLHTTKEAQTPTGTEVYNQTFACDSAFTTLAIAPTPFTDEDKLTLTGPLPEAAVYDGAGNLLGTAQGGPDVLREEDNPLDGYYLFRFGEAVESEDGRYRLELRPGGASFAVSSRSSGDWALFSDGKRQAGTLGFAVQTDPIGNFVAVVYWVFAVLCAAVLSGLFLAIKAGWPLHWLFCLAASALGLLYCLVLPPYAAPDEQFHINQTFNISSAMLGEGPWQVPWGSNYKRASDTDTLVEDYTTTSFSYQRLARDFFTRAGDSTPTKFTGEEVGGYRLIYWPPALMVSLFRLLGAGFVPTLYAGRLANLALYVLLCTWAVRLAPFGKSVFAAVPLLPMSLHLAASFSRDSLTIALYLFYTALCLHYTFVKERVCGKDIALLVVISFLAAPAKAVYAPLLLLCLAIPAKKLQWRGRALPKRLSYAALALVVCVGAISFGWQGGGAIVREAATATPTPFVVRQTGAPAGSAGRTGGAGGGAGGAAEEPDMVDNPSVLELRQAGYNPDSIRYSLQDFFSRPLTIVQLCLRTLTENTTFYLQTMLGGSLSYFSLPISWVCILPLLLLLLAASIPAPGELRPEPLWHLYAGLLALAAAGLVFAGCIVWTPTYYNTIYGIQGRYFLPLLPLGLCATSVLWRGLVKTRDVTGPLLWGGAALSLGVLANALLVVLAR